MSGNALLSGQQGESINFKFDRGGESITGFVCTVKLKQFPDDTATVDREITGDSATESFSDFLTATETADLDIGLWWLIGTLVNATSDIQEEIPRRLNITKSWG